LAFNAQVVAFRKTTQRVHAIWEGRGIQLTVENALVFRSLRHLFNFSTERFLLYYFFRLTCF
jgi:hypothetical protein